ncbi:MAG: DUF3696 domain-containing protein [Nitrospirae bacterium]|nr:DUF3696 domain-containing protein [Nitrospirota bacterium]
MKSNPKTPVILKHLYDPDKIRVDQQTTNLGYLIEMLFEGEIDLTPEFQRSMDLWGPQQKSQLIESLLLGLPLPSFYFSINRLTNKWVIVDGLQRFCTFNDYIIKNELKLSGLEFLKIYEGKTYGELSKADKRKISGTKINFYVIERQSPSYVKFLIFKRVNTGGLVLTPQEIRHALNQGIPSKFIEELAGLEEFKQATDYIIPSKRMEDRDFANRFVAFYLLGYDANYKGELDSFLNDGMEALSTITEDERAKIKGALKDAIFMLAETDEIAFNIKQKDKDDLKFVFGAGIGSGIDVESLKQVVVDYLNRKSIDTDINYIPAVPLLSSVARPGRDFATFLKNKIDPSTDKPFNTDSSIFNTNFQYISAFRNGPAMFYEKDTALVEIFNQMSRKEGRCELVAHYLYYNKKEQVSDKSLTKDKDADPGLIFQVIEWLQEICPNINNIYIDEVSEDSYKVQYSFRRGEGAPQTDKFKALNVGFGVSYVLPIIVAALHTPKDGLVMIENPESHIHPAGQAKLMELICKSAKAGVQFIIETHSDHIVNGLLVATKKGFINHDESRVYYFDRNVSTHATQVTQLSVLEGGIIPNPPEYFFDQMDKDMITLTGF